MNFINAWGKIGIRFNSSILLVGNTIGHDNIDIYIEPSLDHKASLNYSLSNLNFTWHIEKILPSYILVNMTSNKTKYISSGVVPDSLVVNFKDPKMFYSPE